jgi:hypothetical protein
MIICELKTRAKMVEVLVNQGLNHQTLEGKQTLGSRGPSGFSSSLAQA